MSDRYLFKCFLQASPTPTFDIKEDEQNEWQSRKPPIVDILVVAEDNISNIPSDYSIVMNKTSDSFPIGSISYNNRKKGYLCIKR